MNEGDTTKLFAATIIVWVLIWGFSTVHLKTITVPAATADKTSHTHKVWLSPDYMSWQDQDGFGCGHVMHLGNVYVASVIDCSLKEHDRESDFNSFQDAVAYVEQWCKP